jgi:hypothetical protein
VNEKTRPFVSTLSRVSISFVLATIAAKMTLIPFFAVVCFDKILPDWAQLGVVFVGVSLAVFVGVKSFKWLYTYFGNP